jgi:hypothetical protein
MPHTRTFRSSVARGADPWADMSEKPPDYKTLATG